MIQLLDNLPEFVTAFRATGKVDKDDYDSIVTPAVEQVATKFGRINFLLVLETSVANYSIGAWIVDALISLKHFTKWNKIAIVSNQQAVIKAIDLLSPLIHGKSKGFLLTDLEKARKWVSEF